MQALAFTRTLARVSCLRLAHGDNSGRNSIGLPLSFRHDSADSGLRSQADSESDSESDSEAGTPS
eukprot:1184076-Prorocentrum_minimum.AAC.2